MEGTTHQHVHAWQMALRRHAPVLHLDEALAPAFSMGLGGERSDIVIERLPDARRMEYDSLDIAHGECWVGGLGERWNHELRVRRFFSSNTVFIQRVICGYTSAVARACDAPSPRACEIFV